MVPTDIDTAIFNPAIVFKNPNEILEDTKIKLTKEQKIRALQTWQYDVQLRIAAQDENMPSSPKQIEKDSALEMSILKALETLEVPPSKSNKSRLK